MKKLTAASVLALSVTTASLAVVAPAEADSDGYVTHSEFQLVHQGWKINRVDEVFDTFGKWQSQGNGYMSRVYPGWKKKIKVYVTYRNYDGAWRLDYKYATDTSQCGDC